MEGLKKRLNVLLYAIFAGVAVSIGGILYLLTKALIPENSWIPSIIVGSLLFPVGLISICYFKFNLYTGKIGLAFRNPNIDKKGLNVFEWLFWILLGNMIGAIIIGLIIWGLTFINRYSAFSLTIKSVALLRNMPFTAQGVFDMSYKGVLCGVLVYAGVYFFNNLKTTFGKILGIMVPIAFFVYAGLQHCIANMFYIAASGNWNANSLVGLVVCIAANSLGSIVLDLFVKYE